MTILEARGIGVRRAGRRLIDDLSLTLDGGSLVAVIGPNGAGKSTLLTVLAGLSKPDCGTVLLDDVPLADIGRRRLAARRAYLPQGARAEWPISVERLVALGLPPERPFGAKAPRGADARIDRILDDLALAAQRDQPVTTLSGGELARAMLARAIVGQPDVLIADEPLLGLDPRHAIDGMARLRSIADGGTLVIAALHEIGLAARFATHVIALAQGRIAASGPVSDILANRQIIRDIFEVGPDLWLPGW